MQTLKKTCVLAYTIECTVLLLLSHNEVHWEEKHECMARVSSRTPFQHIDHLVPSIHNGLSVTNVLERLRLEPVPSKLMLKLVRGPSKRRGDFFLHILHTCVGVLWVALRSLQDPCTHVISHSGSCCIVEKHSVDVHVGKKNGSGICDVLFDSASGCCEAHLYILSWACRIGISCATVQQLRIMFFT